MTGSPELPKFRVAVCHGKNGRRGLQTSNGVLFKKHQAAVPASPRRPTRRTNSDGQRKLRRQHAQSSLPPALHHRAGTLLGGGNHGPQRLGRNLSNGIDDGETYNFDNVQGATLACDKEIAQGRPQLETSFVGGDPSMRQVSFQGPILTIQHVVKGRPWPFVGSLIPLPLFAGGHKS